MRLRFLGKVAECKNDDCPSLYATDRGTFIVQGKVVTDQEAIAGIRGLGADESFVEIPAELLKLADLA